MTEPANKEQTQGFELETRDDGRLWLRRGPTEVAVRAVPCFPWSNPRRHISLRDDDHVEHALVHDPTHLAPASREALDLAVTAAGFVLEVTAIEDVRDEVEIRHWHVSTKQGSRSFQTPVDSWPRELPGGALLIRDVAGDLFVIRNPASLNSESQRKLWALVG